MTERTEKERETNRVINANIADAHTTDDERLRTCYYGAKMHFLLCSLTDEVTCISGKRPLCCIQDRK